MDNSSYDAVGALFGGALVIVYLLMMLFALVVAIVSVIAMWKIFIKAGKPGWASIVPIYNLWILCEISFNNNILWFILMLVGVTCPVACIASYIGLSKAFGKGVGYGIFMVFFPWLALPMLAFSSAQYIGDKL